MLQSAKQSRTKVMQPEIKEESGGWALHRWVFLFLADCGNLLLQ